jgi:hypothetical protein
MGPWSLTERENAERLLIRPEWQAAFPPDQDDFPDRQAAGCFFCTLLERLERHGRQGAHDAGNVEQTA